MENYQVTKDEIKFGKYYFSLKKCKTQEQRQKFINKIKELLEFTRDFEHSVRASASQDQKSFIYQNLTQYENRQWRIRQKQTYSAVYKHIPTILFSSTTVINLAYCSITNIQVFAYLQAPNLHTLEIFENHIMTIKPLAKNNDLRQMENLTLYRNSITDFSALQRARADIMIYFQLDIKKQDKVVCEDLSVFFKVPVASKSSILRFWGSSSQRINRANELMHTRFKQKIGFY